ncbi:MAG: DUF2807 domain-containing protein [Bacteroidetes bacterium]|nr:DUF2807 domain-containing protein [Bacteroidota bacterium]
MNTFKNDELDFEINGSGVIEADVVANKITSNISGSGILDLSGSANSFNMQISGSGTVNSFNLVTLDAKASISGSGEADVNAGKSLYAKVSGSGAVRYLGWGVFDLVASQFAASGFGFIKFNFAFNGTTLENPLDFDDLDAFGNNNFTHELDDLEVAIDFLISNAEAYRVDINRIYLAGHSRGGGIVILKAAEDSRVKGITSWAAVAGFARHITVQDIRYWRQAGVFYVENSRTGQQMPLYPQLYENYYRNRNRLNILKAAERLQVPFLIIHGDEDETVPVDHALEPQ